MIASGQVPANPAHTDLTVWTGPTSLLTGALFVAVCAYLAATFLTQEASRRADRRLRRYFAQRAAMAGTISGALSLATLAEIDNSNPALYHGLTNRALPRHGRPPGQCARPTPPGDDAPFIRAVN